MDVAIRVSIRTRACAFGPRRDGSLRSTPDLCLDPPPLPPDSPIDRKGDTDRSKGRHRSIERDGEIGRDRKRDIKR
eukprot:scaffold110_cov315-Pavlova_lutheri.AAC.19